MVNYTIKCAVASYTEKHLNQCGISRKIPGSDDAWTEFEHESQTRIAFLTPNIHSGHQSQMKSKLIIFL